MYAAFLHILTMGGGGIFNKLHFTKMLKNNLHTVFKIWVQLKMIMYLPNRPLGDWFISTTAFFFYLFQGLIFNIISRMIKFWMGAMILLKIYSLGFKQQSLFHLLYFLLYNSILFYHKFDTISDINMLFFEIQTLVLVIIQLCQRNSGKMDEANREVIHNLYRKKDMINC